MDAKITFLIGDLDKEIYIEQPESFFLLENEENVLQISQVAL